MYGRPATLYVAAFLGAPRMNLLEASVYVHLDRYIALNLGEQSLYLPWNDIRARAVAHYHGERIVVGMRAEALTPVAPDFQGDVLHGRIRYLEHHGHESLAFLDVGATAIVVDELAGKTAPDAGRADRRAQAVRRGAAAADRPRRRPAAVQAGDSEPTQRAARPGPAPPAARPSWRCGWRRTRRSRPGIRWPSRCGWTRCTSSTSAATGSTSAGGEARFRHQLLTR